MGNLQPSVLINCVLIENRKCIQDDILKEENNTDERIWGRGEGERQRKREQETARESERLGGERGR